MIIPTPDFDPLFASDGIPFQDKMCAYIRGEFSDVLGTHAPFLTSPGGLDVLSRIYTTRLIVPVQEQKAA